MAVLGVLSARTDDLKFVGRGRHIFTRDGTNLMLDEEPMRKLGELMCGIPEVSLRHIDPASDDMCLSGKSTRVHEN